ncbi:MAG: DUF2231 domain-containing protein [Nitrospirota bacterium]
MTHPLHPIIVHFPIALLITAIVLGALELVLKRDALREAATWLLGFGFMGGLVAAATGILAEEAAEEGGVPEGAIETHESLAFAALAVFALLIVIRWLQRKRSIPNSVFLAIGVIGVVLIALTGYFGGDLVYRYGAGVERPAPAATHETP